MASISEGHGNNIEAKGCLTDVLPSRPPLFPNHHEVTGQIVGIIAAADLVTGASKRTGNDM